MSGIELAGLLVGAFPILIHVMEKYRSGAEIAQDWWLFRSAYKKCRQDLLFHSYIFEETVERFLLPLLVDDDELMLLLADPAGPHWKNADLEARLQERLPKSYHLFLDIMNDINELVMVLRKQLGLDDLKFQAMLKETKSTKEARASHTEFLSLSNIEFQAKTIKFSLLKSSRDRLFSKLREANDRMRNLLESSDQVFAARRSRGKSQSQKASRALYNFWKNAQMLHNALCNSWKCGCVSHIANLHLEHRTSPKSVEFGIFFESGPGSSRDSFRKINVAMIPVPLNGRPAEASAEARQANLPKKKRQIRWSDDIRRTDQNHKTERPTMNMIQDLCSAVSSNGQPHRGDFIDEHEHRFVFHPVLAAPSIQHPIPITLEAVLNESVALTRRKRYFLALTLASSYLQLGATPWIKAPLRKQNIVFFQDSSQPDTVWLEHPYICCETVATAKVDTNLDALSSLGIRLLELCFGSPLESNKYRQQLPPGDDVSSQILDHAAAISWSKMVSEEAGPEFAEAIEWCLHAKQSSDGSWRKEMWSNVIEPLDACHRQVSQTHTVL